MRAAVAMLKPAGLAFAAVTVASTAVVGISLATSTKADFALTATPGSTSVAAGQAATYTISEQATNGFSASVALGVSGLPAGASATFSPNPLVKGSTTSALSIDTSSVAPSTSTLTITGTSGSLAHTVTVGLTVTAAPPPPFSVSASPSSTTMLPGDTAAYSVTVSRQSGFTGSVSLALSSGLPSGGTATFTPATLSGSASSSSLSVSTKNNSASGAYSLVITATSGGRSQSATVSLVLAGSGKSFGISLPTPVAGLAPGVRRPLNLQFANPNSQPVSITNITIAIQTVTKSASAPAGKPCGMSDYGVVQYAGAYPLVIPAGATVSLSALVSNSASWPAVVMNDPNVDQDGCRGATLAVSFSGAGQG